mmetsp:Transcript_69162/g.225380  ORF Transcript_69162/g.225380 Transcript_69162/m.225380 type:complete len:202 (+) Transcript_69162:95-700(+)|eukprot:CAMPEP_0203971198 /NCGR_PEP_ID=MMETSP0359-20131031/98353_1 /ASSEMBLY_ACC=CAM_ASM_000338 /TAXON_ID=268821 /ORGANISM="Scrippsiella Hangoei, Strain SHTV-5" /LENGTH=201 /DNA_ID=CAMNT_0050909165 /DNA_START=68 /DNA_END=673 /DNA_ORIENTATION=-
MALLCCCTAEEDEPDLVLQKDSGTFEVKLEAPQARDSLGLHLELSDGMTAYVSRVSLDHSMPAGAYNLHAPEGNKLEVGLYILEINGVSGDAQQMKDVIRSGVGMIMRCRHPQLSVVKVKKYAHQSMGLDLQFTAQGRVLTICKIFDGAVQESGVDVKPGDRIIQIDGREGTANELLARIAQARHVELTISRCPEVTNAFA